MTQQTFKEVMAEEIEEAIEIAEDEILHDIREAYMAASASKQKEADAVLMEIRMIYDHDEDDKELDIFAKVLKLEITLGLC